MADDRAERRALGREADRRRQAASELRMAASMAAYAATQVGDGLTPAQARQALVEAAMELEAVAASVRRLARLRARERARLARLLAAQGHGTQEIATRLGVSAHTAWHYCHGRRGDGQPWASG
jgi:DNA-binding CsgD family transcriptional regulator